MERHIPSPAGVLAVCREVAATTFDTRPPSNAYAESAARLLFGTCAQESKFIYRRQMKRGGGLLSMNSLTGGWGLWQCESGSVTDSIAYLKRRPAMLAKLIPYLARYGHDLDIMLKAAPLGRMRALARNDYVACVFARLHYLRVPESIPSSVDAQAIYWKRHYNTRLGKGTPQQYLQAWNKYCAPLLK